MSDRSKLAPMGENEADTCRLYVTPKLQAAGWESEPASMTEQYGFTDGRIVVVNGRTRRRPGKRADYLLRYRRDYPIAVVEAKSADTPAGEGLQQAKDYAEILGLKFAYATNGREIIEFDYLTGFESTLSAFPSPEELWARMQSGIGFPDDPTPLLAPFFLNAKPPRYYQTIAINRVVEAILKGQRRILVTMATGTGKTTVAFQICHKLWSSRWNRDGEYRRPKILFLADRNILVDDPKDKDFIPFGDARWKIENGVVQKGRDIYFAIYQSIAKDERRPGLYKEYPRDFFDLIIIDECHRGSARDDSNWREILEYFEPACQLGLTATPLREDNRDTYAYFGNPLYEYSLRQGIDDGFLAPYTVHRVVTSYDAAGWRPSKGEVDRFGRDVPDEEYQTKDFERVISLRARTEAIAKHLTDYMKKTDRFAKTIVFCVDQEHADEMRRALNNLNADLVKHNSDYVCRVTADDKEIGRGHLGRFQDPEQETPVILTSSQLLTTGVDAPMVKNVVLVRVVGSMSEFKQIIGRGTRLRVERGKLFFNILDYTGSATQKFADPDFDGTPVHITGVDIDDEGNPVPGSETEETAVPPTDGAGPDSDEPAEEEGIDLPPFTGGDGGRTIVDPPPGPRKYYVDGGQVEIVAHMVSELDPDGKQLRTVKFTDYTAERVRTICRSSDELLDAWADPERRVEIMRLLEDRGIGYDELASATNRPDADLFDLLCHVAFNAPLLTRRERADRLRKNKPDFFDTFGPEARAILSDLLDKYAEHGESQFVFPDVLKVPPISERGNISEIIEFFGGAARLRDAVQRLQTMLYVA